MVRPATTKSLLPFTGLLGYRHDIEVIEAPISLGQPEPGVRDAYPALIRAGIFSELAALPASDVNAVLRNFIHSRITLPSESETGTGRTLVSLPPGGNRSRDFGLFRNEVELGVRLEAVAAAAFGAASQGRFALTIGGDHSVAVGSIFGLQSYWQNLGVIWVDAHADFNSPTTSPSHNFHGMPLAALCNVFTLRDVKSFDWFRPCLRPEDVVIIGARNLDPGETRALRKLGVRVHSSQEVKQRGMLAVAHDALDYLLAQGQRPLHLSFDIDALDGEIVPGTGTPEPEGLNLDETALLCESLRGSGLLVGMDLVEINPDLESRRAVRKPLGGSSDLTIGCAAMILRKIFSED